MSKQHKIGGDPNMGLAGCIVALSVSLASYLRSVEPPLNEQLKGVLGPLQDTLKTILEIDKDDAEDQEGSTRCFNCKCNEITPRIIEFMVQKALAVINDKECKAFQFPIKPPPFDPCDKTACKCPNGSKSNGRNQNGSSCDKNGAQQKSSCECAQNKAYEKCLLPKTNHMPCFNNTNDVSNESLKATQQNQTICIDLGSPITNCSNHSNNATKKLNGNQCGSFISQLMTKSSDNCQQQKNPPCACPPLQPAQANQKKTCANDTCKNPCCKNMGQNGR